MKRINDIYFTASIKLDSFLRKARNKLTENNGQFAMDNGVAMVIIVAVAAVLLALLIAYFKGEFATNVKNNISDLFGQS